MNVAERILTTYSADRVGIHVNDKKGERWFARGRGAGPTLKVKGERWFAKGRERGQHKK